MCKSRFSNLCKRVCVKIEKDLHSNPVILAYFWFFFRKFDRAERVGTGTLDRVCAYIPKISKFSMIFLFVWSSTFSQKLLKMTLCFERFFVKSQFQNALIGFRKKSLTIQPRTQVWPANQEINKFLFRTRLP